MHQGNFYRPPCTIYILLQHFIMYHYSKIDCGYHLPWLNVKTVLITSINKLHFWNFPFSTIKCRENRICLKKHNTENASFFKDNKDKQQNCFYMKLPICHHKYWICFLFTDNTSAHFRKKLSWPF